MKKLFCSLLIISCITTQLSNLQAQNNVGIGTPNPNSKAILDLTANNKGLLVPRVTTTQRLAINPVGNNDAALLVYDTNDSLFYFWNSVQWVSFPQQGGSNNISLNYDANTGNLSLTDIGGTLTTNITLDNDADSTNELITGVVFNANGNILTINEGNNTWSTTISIVDPDSDPTNEIQQLTLSNNILNLSISNNNVNLAPYLDNTDNQTLSINGNTLSISNGNSVTIPVTVNTDNQTLSINGQTLSISGGNSVDITAGFSYSGEQCIDRQGTGSSQLNLTNATGVNTGNGFCFLTYVRGKFEGAGEFVRVTTNGGSWVVDIQNQQSSGGDVRACARCFKYR